MKGFAICTSPRSGSNYFGEILSATGRLGRPLEYFNAPARRALEAPNYPNDIQAQIQWILTKGATPNGVYGLKLFPDQFAAALKRIDLFAHLPDLRFARLKRRDWLGQAISWARALQTEQYRATQNSRAEPSYDCRLIMTQLVAIARAEASWDVYFARTGQAAEMLFYEDIEAKPERAVRAVADLMGLEGETAINRAAVKITRQRDGLNEDWRAKFLAEYGGRHWIDVM
jgi:LPS sulfotransferase NodH